MPRRRTFADAIVASALSEVACAPASCLRWPPTPAPGAWAALPAMEGRKKARRPGLGV